MQDPFKNHLHKRLTIHQKEWKWRQTNTLLDRGRKYGVSLSQELSHFVIYFKRMARGIGINKTFLEINVLTEQKKMYSSQWVPGSAS